jgi:hypothetical protein
LTKKHDFGYNNSIVNKQEFQMRTLTIIPGFKNSQRFRVIFRQGGSEYDIGMYMTIKQMSDSMATVHARTSVWNALERLSAIRKISKRAGESQLPTGLVCTEGRFDVQVDLV